MSLLQQQKELRELRGGTRKERLEIADKRALRRTLDSSPNSKRVQLTSNYENYDCLILSRRADLQITDKKFIFESSVPAKQGEVVIHEDKWIMLHEDTTEYGVAKKFIGRKISDEVYFFISGQYVKAPIYTILTASVDDPLDRRIVNSVYRENPDKEAIVIVPKNDFTKEIQKYDRFISFDLVYQITFVNKSPEGLVLLTARIVPPDSNTDDLTTGKTKPADAEVIDLNAEIVLEGPDSLLEDEIFTYSAPVECNLEASGSVKVLEVTPNSITVKADSIGQFKITASSSETSISKIIRVIGLF